MFDNAIHLFSSTAAVAEYSCQVVFNWSTCGSDQGPGASKVSCDDAGRLEPVVCLAEGARVMLTANLCVQAGLVN